MKFSCDLLTIPDKYTKIKKRRKLSNRIMNYALIAICHSSKYVFYTLLRRKSAQCMKIAFKDILKQIRKLKKKDLFTRSSKENITFYSDFGAEFSPTTQTFLEAYDATLINVGNKLRRRKASQIETFIRDLQRKLALKLQNTESLKDYILLLKHVVKNYNQNWINSETDSTPIQFLQYNSITKLPWAYRLVLS